MNKYCTVDETFQALEKNFRPSEKDVMLSYLFDISGWGKRVVLISGRRCVVIDDMRHNDPDVSVFVSKRDYLEIVNGEVTLPVAFISGALTITGSVDAAEQLARFFPKPRVSSDVVERSLILEG